MPPNDKPLEYTWVIGASTGIGRALSLELARQGYLVAISARNEHDLQSVLAEIQNIDAHRPHICIPCDVCNLDSLEHAYQSIVQKGALTRVISMAGIYEPMDSRELDVARVEKVIHTNLTACFYIAKVVLPALLACSKGQLVFCASVAGYCGLPNGQPYSATKAGLINYAESLRSELGESIDIKVICPGFVKTRLTEKNTFQMPWLLEVESAAQIIARQLNQKGFEIHFPKRLSWSLKLLRILPYTIYFWCTRRLRS